MEITKIKHNPKEQTITFNFEKNGQRGKCRYILYGEHAGIDFVENYEERDDEDIYADIHELFWGENMRQIYDKFEVKLTIGVEIADFREVMRKYIDDKAIVRGVEKWKQ